MSGPPTDHRTEISGLTLIPQRTEALGPGDSFSNFGDDPTVVNTQPGGSGWYQGRDIGTIPEDYSVNSYGARYGG